MNPTMLAETPSSNAFAGNSRYPESASSKCPHLGTCWVSKKYSFCQALWIERPGCALLAGKTDIAGEKPSLFLLGRCSSIKGCYVLLQVFAWVMYTLVTWAAYKYLSGEQPQ